MVSIGSSNSYRLLITAIGFLAVLFVAQSSWADQGAPKSSEEAKITVEHNQRRADDKEQPKDTLTKLQKAKPATEARASKQQEDETSSEEDETPDWSNWWRDPMATFNAMLVLLTVVLAAFGISQYFTSRGLTRRQLRAYVFVDSIGLLDGSMVKPLPAAQFIDIPGANIVLKNTGQTPARDVFHWANIDVIECRHEEVLKIPPATSPANAAIPTSGTISKTLIFPRVITQAEKDGIFKGTHGIYVWGIVRYSDIFRRARFTEYRFRYSGSWPPPDGHTLNFCDVGNDHS